MQIKPDSGTPSSDTFASRVGGWLPSAVLAAGAALVLVLAVVLALQLRAERRQLIENGYAVADRSALRLAAHAREVLSRADKATLVIKSVRESRVPTTLDALHQAQIMGEDTASAFLVTDADGRVVESTSDALVDLADSEAFKSLAEHDGSSVVIGVPLRDLRRGGTVVPVMRRLDGRERFDGAVVALLRPHTLVLGALDERSDSMVRSIFGLDGFVRARRLRGDVSADGRVPEPERTLAHMRELRAAGVIDVSPIDGRHITPAAAPVEGYPLLALAADSAGAIDAAYARSRERTLGWGAAAALLLIAGCFTLWHQARQLESSRRAAARASALYEATLEGGLDALWLMDPVRNDAGAVDDFVICEANQRSLQMIELPRERVVGRRFSELLPSERDDGLRGLLLRAHFEQRPFHVEAQRTAEPLLGQWLHLQAVPARGSVALIARDITERRAAAEQMAGREAFLRTLIEALPLAVCAKSMRPQTHGQVLFWNKAAERQYGRRADEVIGRCTDAYLPPEAATIAILQDTEVVRAGTAMSFHGMPWQTERGLRHLNFMKAPVFGSDGAVDMLLVIAEDVTEQRAGAERLQLMSRVVQETGDAIVVADAQGNVLLTNASFAAMSGRPPETLVNAHMRDLGLPKPNDQNLPGVEAALRTRRRWAGEYVMPRLNREPLEVWMQICAMTDEAGQITHLAGIFSDISVQKKQERALAELARRDPLTQLANRRYFEEQLEAAAARAARQGEPLALLYLDLDSFKQVNDEFGHEAGDQLLVEVARRLRQCVRATDLVSRLGGDEFTVILEHAGTEANRNQQCARVLEELSRPHLFNGHFVVATPSIGMAVYRPDESIESLRHRADAAMYTAKRSGKGRVQVAEEAVT